MKVVIVGGVAGGASAAARLRRLDERAEIIVFERSGYVSYANCGLPYFIGGSISEKKELTLKTPESFNERFRIDVRVRHEVRSIDVDRKTVTVCDLENDRIFEESFDKLILSPGASAVVPDIPGTDLEGVFTLRTVEDTFRIKDRTLQKGLKSAVVIGGGFIGLEMAENLKELGLEVTVAERLEQLMTTMDSDMAGFVHGAFRKAGVALKLKAEVTAIEEEGGRLLVRLRDDVPLAADIVILAVGVRPDSTLAKAAGLELGLKGSIAVDDHMRTSNPDIYAVGDAVQVKHMVSGRDAVISLAGPANKQGRIAADNICGIPSVYAGSLGSSVIKIFDMTAASTGLTERAAREAGFDCESVILFPASHASYYPGSSNLAMKMVFEKGSYKILGAQIAGYEGADKRIDVIATAIKAGLKAYELKDLDLAYAPPYSSAKDPVNMAGFMVENIMLGLVKQFHIDEIPALRDDPGAVLLDTRTVREYEAGHADGFINIPLDSLRDRLGELDSTKRIYIMCQTGIRSYIGSRILAQNGFDVFNFTGGYRYYEAVTRDKELVRESFPCGMDRETVPETGKKPKVSLNPDAEMVKIIREGLEHTGGYCPCRRERIPENICMCKEFREQIADPDFEGFCHCMLYYKSK